MFTPQAFWTVVGITTSLHDCRAVFTGKIFDVSNESHFSRLEQDHCSSRRGFNNTALYIKFFMFSPGLSDSDLSRFER
jgi:hypothetical protein